MGPGISFYRKSKINIKRKPNYEIHTERFSKFPSNIYSILYGFSVKRRDEERLRNLTVGLRILWKRTTTIRLNFNSSMNMKYTNSTKTVQKQYTNSTQSVNIQYTNSTQTEHKQ